jgi:hypothetical protein
MRHRTPSSNARGNPSSLMPREQLLSFLIHVNTSSTIKVWMLRNCCIDLPRNERFRAAGSIPSSSSFGDFTPPYQTNFAFHVDLTPSKTAFCCRGHVKHTFLQHQAARRRQVLRQYAVAVYSSPGSHLQSGGAMPGYRGNYSPRLSMTA